MEKNLNSSEYIPLDKSWIIRMGVLDMVNDRQDIVDFLTKEKNLGDDLLALKRAAISWKSSDPVDVGESGTLYRMLKFASWKLGLDKKFVTQGTLKDRKINNDPNIVKLSQTELLKLDNGTSQWATAATLLGDKERLSNTPFKLKVTYDAVDHWKSQRTKNKKWEPRYDETILNQAKTYLELMKGNQVKFEPEQAEDFCFAYTFGYVTAEEGEKRWPSLRGHETDRIVEMEEMFNKAKSGQEVDSKDHRVVQAIVMWGKVNKKEVKIIYPDSVNKSWPQFWHFIKDFSEN